VEPDGDWMAAAARLELPVLAGEQWALIERGWRVQILKELNDQALARSAAELPAAPSSPERI
jgi:hypothetical protein